MSDDTSQQQQPDDDKSMADVLQDIIDLINNLDKGDDGDASKDK